MAVMQGQCTNSLNEYTKRTTVGPAFKSTEEMKFEVLRLASFTKWPNWAPKRPTCLAENGFYYVGDGDRVRCFSCKTEISNWTAEDKVTEKHRTLSPTCDFINGRDTSNAPMLVSDGGNHGNTISSSPSKIHADCARDDLRQDSGYDSLEELRSHGNRNLTKPPALLVTGKEHNNIKDADELLEELRSLSPPTSHHSNEPEEQDDTDNPSSAPAPVDLEEGTGQIDEVDMQFVKYESYRLRTFYGKWPENSFIAPAALAKAGFYFVSTPDRVQCAFCKGRLLNWNPTDSPMTEHRKHFSSCPFVRDRNVGNIPIEQSQSSVQVPKQWQQKKEPSTSERLGIMMDKPKHPEYAIESTRLDSFRTWPKKTTIQPSELATAGFFYVGYSDNVKCFFCDGGLRNWERGDVPWREHAQWFSRCGFLKLKMGDDFISKVLAETKQGKKTGHNIQQTFGDQVVARGSPPAPLDPRAVKARMDTPMVRTVIDMGFSRELVQKVLDTKLKREGDDFVNAEELLQAVFEEQEAEQKEKNHAEKVDKEAVAEDAQAPSPKPATSRRKKKNRNKRKKKNDANTAEAGAEGAVAGAEGGAETDSAEEVPEQPLITDADVQQDKEVQVLVKQYHRIKDERTCKICMDEECTIVFLPCGHLVCCANCAPALRNCPICRTTIKGSVRVYTT